MLTRLLNLGIFCLFTVFLSAQNLPNPILFCAQIPNPYGFATSMETFGNQHASMYAAPRGGDLYIRYPNGTLRNLTQLAGYGQNGMQGATSIAVRDPHVHWDGEKALFSMAIGAPTQQYQWLTFYWQIYEVTGLGQNDTPVVTLLPNQPTNYNNIQPIYGSDDRIIFTSDRPRGGEPHLYPQHDEYESSPVVTGLWRLDPTACTAASALEMLTHAPSGDFTPSIDHFGRVVFTRWDHLQRDQQADADIMNNAGYGTFNYLNESDTATKFSNVPDYEVFPEPRASRTDLLNLPAWVNTNGHTFNVFTPWMMNENGTESEMLNHLGRHEMGNYFVQNFTNDPNLHDYYTPPSDQPIRAMFHIQESPTTPGLYYGTEAPEFGTHASGMIISVYAPPGVHPETVDFTYITHPATRSPTNSPTSNHSGMYRDPLPISNGEILVQHTTETREDQNEGSTDNPISRYHYRLKLLVPVGNYFKASTTAITSAGISKNVQWWSPDVLVTFNGLLWETYPVEVVARPRPANPTLEIETVPAIEQAIFTSAQVDMNGFRRFLKRNKLAMLVARDVTSRDDADQQQPFNLKVFGSSHQTTNPNEPGILYTVKYLQFLQADQIRGIGGINDPTPGRRNIAQFLHDPTSMVYNLPSSGAQGSVNIHSDGSAAAIVPAGRALAWQLTDSTNRGIIRERLWVSAVAGEVRVCTSCHGESTLNQAGLTSPTNPPLALTAILNHIKVFDRDNDGTEDIDDAFPLDPTRQIAEPLSEDFVTNLTKWVNQNPDNDNVFWTAKPNIPCFSISAVINNRLSNNTGKIDRLRRFVDLTEISEAKLTFDVAYARYNSTRFDRLRIKIVKCDGTEQIVYDKSGSVLATSPDQTAVFTPADCSKWRNECVNLSQFAGKMVELVFEDIGGYGNRLFLDNIKIQEVNSGVPIPTIVGEAEACKNATENYTLGTSPPAGTPIQWTVSGGSVISGQGTASVFVQWGTGNSGSLNVQVGQTCLASAAKHVELRPGPTANIITDPSNALPGCSTGVNLSTNDSTAFTFQWFKNGVLIAGATQPNYVAGEGGQFKVAVEYAAAGCTTEDLFTVNTNFACNPNFCNSHATNSTSEWIQSFSVSSSMNVSGNNNGYGNFLDAIAPITLQKGTALTFTLTPGYSGTAFSERWRVWMDFNHDGDFLDDGELLFSKAGANVQTKVFIIPNTRPNGATRMRVSMKRGSYSTSCEAFANGEVEDYVVIVGSPSSAPPPPTNAKTVQFANLDFSIFPNPASEMVVLTCSTPQKVMENISIFDALGSQIATFDATQQEFSELKIDVSRWVPGVYFVKIGEQMAGRFAVQR